MIKALVCALFCSFSLIAAEYPISFDFSSSFKNGEWQGQWEESDGSPKVPVQYLQWLIPNHEKIESITIKSKRGGDGPTPMNIVESPTFRPICETSFRENAKHIFAKGSTFPKKNIGEFQVIVKHGFRILVLPIYPILYLPNEKLGTTTRQLVVSVQTENTAENYQLGAPIKADIADVSRIVSNPEMIKTYPKARQENGNVTYLVVGPEEYLNDLATWEFLEQKTKRSISAGTHSLEKIENETEGADIQEKVRNAIKKHYTEDGTRYVLLIGNGYNLLPTRNINVGGESLGSDLYFGCFDGEMDFACEVAVGRAPVSNIEEYRTFVKKTLAAKAITMGDPHAKNALLFGENMDGSTLASSALEQLVNGGSAGSIYTHGYPDTANITRLSETFSQHFTASEVIDSINEGAFYTVNHMGHASQSYCMRMQASDIKKLTNQIGFFGITQGCHPGDLHGPNWATKLVLHPSGGAFAQIANSGYGWYQPGSSDGPSNRHNLVFYDSVFNEGIHEIGRANMRAKERLAAQANSNQTMKKVLVETNLLGDPEFSLVID